jgi:hypothetical protein
MWRMLCRVLLFVSSDIVKEVAIMRLLADHPNTVQLHQVGCAAALLLHSPGLCQTHSPSFQSLTAASLYEQYEANDTLRRLFS